MSTKAERDRRFAKRYSPEFKQEALALMAAGRSMSQVSRDLGVSILTLGEWKKLSKASAPGAAAARIPEPAGGDATTLAAEVVRLRKALAKSELHADILKKPWPLSARTRRTLSLIS
jgi:transposase-like protein